MVIVLELLIDALKLFALGVVFLWLLKCLFLAIDYDQNIRRPDARPPHDDERADGP
jgi:hypothetical protein